MGKCMEVKKYKVQFTESSRDDMRGMKEYILRTFCYRELGENFTRKMRKAVEKLKIMPMGYDALDFEYKGYKIYLKPYMTYLFFYIVEESKSTVTILRILQDGMNWQHVMKRWLKSRQ